MDQLSAGSASPLIELYGVHLHPFEFVIIPLVILLLPGLLISSRLRLINKRPAATALSRRNMSAARA